MTNYNIDRLGGNQYSVTIDGVNKTIDLDGFTVMSNKEYDELGAAGVLLEEAMCPAISQFSGDDLFFAAAVESAANYSGFIAQEYIKNNK